MWQVFLLSPCTAAGLAERTKVRSKIALIRRWRSDLASGICTLYVSCGLFGPIRSIGAPRVRQRVCTLVGDFPLGSWFGLSVVFCVFPARSGTDHQKTLLCHGWIIDLLRCLCCILEEYQRWTEAIYRIGLQ